MKILLGFLKFFSLLIKKKPLAAAGAVVIIVVVIAGVFAPFLTPYSYDAMSPPERLESPSLKHPLGTDDYGRDVYTRLLYGARFSIMVGASSIFIATFWGVLLGTISGYKKGLIGDLIMRFMDGMLAFPLMILAIALVAALGPGIVNAIIAIGVAYIPNLARITRSAVLLECEQEYVEASRAIGSSDLRIMFIQILPNCLAPVIVESTICLAFAILIESNLSFLGMGVQPPVPSWGNMVSAARNYMGMAPWISIFSGGAIALVVLSFNVFGDGLRDVMDVRIR
jgi:peptide/nickel transport system permease protein